MTELEALRKVTESIKTWVEEKFEKKPIVLSGVWQFDDDLTGEAGTIEQSIKFERPGGEVFSSIIFYMDENGDDASLSIYNSTYDNNETVFDKGWIDQSYRIIDFGTEPQEVSQEFYDWFVANAEKLSTFETRVEGSGGSGKAGTYYYVPGMTWEEFVLSDNEILNCQNFTVTEDAVFMWIDGSYELQLYGSNEIDAESGYMANAFSVKPTDKIQYKYYGVSD